MMVKTYEKNNKKNLDIPGLEKTYVHHNAHRQLFRNIAIILFVHRNVRCQVDNKMQF